MEITDTDRINWLDETQALCDDGDGTPFYQEWRVTASQNYRGIREAIDAAIRKTSPVPNDKKKSIGIAAAQ